MKTNIDKTFISSLLYNFILLIVISILIYGPDSTGPVGDTFGGIFSPVIGIVSVYFIYETFKAQREQLEDQKNINEVQRKYIEEQRNQYQLSGITETIYLQLSRIDESIKAGSFVFLGPPREEVKGYNGLYLLTESIKQENKNLENILADLQAIHTLFNSNISQLMEIYDRVSIAVVVINNLLSDYHFDPSQKVNLSRLIILNLGESFRDNVNQVSKFIDWYSTTYENVYKVFISEEEISKLRQLVNVVRDFYYTVKV